MSVLKKTWGWSKSASVLGLCILILWAIVVFAQINQNFGPSSSVVTSSTSGSAIDAATSPYNVVGDGRYSTAATITNGSSTISCPTTDCNFTAADVGKKCSGFTNNNIGILVLPAGCSISTFISSTQVTVSVTANASASGINNNTFYYGTDQTVGVTAAFAAEHAFIRCGSIRFPSGFITLAGNGTTSPYGSQNTTCAPTGNIDNVGEDIGGQGFQGTNFVFLPSYGNVNFIDNTVTQGPVHLHDMHINGMGWAAYTGQPIRLASDSIISNFKMSGFGQTAIGVFISGNTGWCSLINFYTEYTGINEIGGRCNIFNGFWNTALQIDSTGIVNDYGGLEAQSQAGYNGLIDNSHGGVYSCFGVFSVTSSSSTVQMRMGAGSTSYLNHCKIGGNSGGQYGIFWDTGGGTVYSSNQTIIMGGTNGALNNVSNNTPANFYDDGTTTFSGSISNFTTASNSNYTVSKNVHGACTGVGTANTTLGLYGTGPNVTATTCTSGTIGSGIVAQGPGTLTGLIATATAAGTNASSGVVTVLKNGVAQTLTCTIGTGTRCNDVAHTVAYVAGDLISINFTTQLTDTLAGVKAQTWPLF